MSKQNNRYINIDVPDKSKNRAQGGIVAGLAGGIAGGMARIFVAPFDVLEIRWQVQNHRVVPFEYIKRFLTRDKSNIPAARQYRSLWQSILKITKDEGVFALWKGNMSAQIMTMTYGAAQFGAYGFVKPIMRVQAPAYIPEKQWSFISSLISGSVAGIFATMCSYPFDLMRTRLAAQQEPKIYKSMRHGFSMVYSTGGIRSLYTGLWPTLVLIAPYTSIAFCSFDYFKSLVQSKRVSNNQSSSLSSADALFCGFFAGLLAKFSTYPLDVCKKRFQVGGFNYNASESSPQRYRGVYHCLTSIIKNEGFFALFKGTLPSLFKSVPNSALSFMIFEWCKAFF